MAAVEQHAAQRARVSPHDGSECRGLHLLEPLHATVVADKRQGQLPAQRRVAMAAEDPDRRRVQRLLQLARRHVGTQRARRRTELSQDGLTLLGHLGEPEVARGHEEPQAVRGHGWHGEWWELMRESELIDSHRRLLQRLGQSAQLGRRGGKGQCRGAPSFGFVDQVTGRHLLERPDVVLQALQMLPDNVVARPPLHELRQRTLHEIQRRRELLAAVAIFVVEPDERCRKLGCRDLGIIGIGTVLNSL